MNEPGSKTGTEQQAPPEAETEIEVEAVRIVTETIEKLGPPSGRHVNLFLGAGASMTAGIPGLAQLQASIGDDLDGEFKDIWDRVSKDRNLEAVLSYLRTLASLLSTGGELNGIDAATAAELDRRLCTAISSRVSVDPPPNGLEAHVRLARWLGRSTHALPIEVFTTNYDTLIERALESAGVPYFDGFVGIHRGLFRADLVDGERPVGRESLAAGWVRVWKLHGSVNWMIDRDEGRLTITRQSAVDDAKIAAIYPSAEKYDESRRLPFVALSDRLRRAMALPETVTVTVGYSYRDEHINDLLFEAVARYPRSELVATFKGEIPTQVADVATMFPNLTALGAHGAILSMRRAKYAAAPAGPGWSGDLLTLGEFGDLASVLSRVADNRDRAE